MMFIHQDGWTRSVPEGAAFLEIRGTTFLAWDAKGNELAVPPHIAISNPPWYQRIREAHAVADDN